MAKKRKKQPITVTLDPDLIKRVKTWIAAQKLPPPQNVVVEQALEKFLFENRIPRK